MEIKWIVIVTFLIGLVTVKPGAAWAEAVGTLTTLYSFSGGDGATPLAGLVQSSDGNFYGITSYGGANNNGTIFKLTPGGVLTTLYSFSGLDNSDGANQPGPRFALVEAGDGSFYGTTSTGGTSDYGTVFKITSSGNFTIVHSFSGNSPNDGYGDMPYGPLLQGSDGDLYGTTYYGESTGLAGTVFKVDTAGNFSVVSASDAFTSSNYYPQGTLVQESNGYLYGTTQDGGPSNYGTVFCMKSDGSLTTVYDFQNNGDSGYPGTLMLGPDGYLYGTSNPAGNNSSGSIFKISPGGQFTLLHSFTGGDDSAMPQGPLVFGSDGNLYSSAEGYFDDYGIIFKISPAGEFTVLHRFDVNDGSGPGPIIEGSDGNLYGTTGAGGTGGINGADIGTVFKLVVDGLHPAFFRGEVSLSAGTYYLGFSTGNFFGYYSYLTDPSYIYHFDLGYEYVFDAADGNSGVYLYDFESSDFFYTNPTFPFPYLYDFGLNSVLYYFPDPNNAGRYNTNGVRYFYDFNTGKIITK